MTRVFLYVRHGLRTLRVRGKGGGYRVAWHQLDLSDPLRPRLRCPISELPLIDER